MDEYNWDDWDQQAAEYLNSPYYSGDTGGYLTDAQYSDLSSYDPSYYTDLSASDLNTLLAQALGQSSTTPSISDLSNLGVSDLMFGGAMPTDIFGENYPSEAQTYTLATGLPFDQTSKYVDGQEYVLDNDGNIVGFRNEDGTVQYYSDIRNAVNSQNKVASGSSGSYKTQLSEALAKQALQQLQSKQSVANSGVGQALGGLASAAALYQALAGKNQGATTQARANTGQAFGPQYKAAAAPKTKYATGGSVSYAKGGLLPITEKLVKMLEQKSGLIGGEGGGQDDVVDIKAAPGEYVMDAEVVSSLGDGNNEEGARKLDKMRMEIRKHKRQGGLTSIAPKAKRPEQYIKKGK